MKRDASEKANEKELIEIVKKEKDADSNLSVSEIKLIWWLFWWSIVGYKLDLGIKLIRESF